MTSRSVDPMNPHGDAAGDQWVEERRHEPSSSCHAASSDMYAARFDSRDTQFLRDILRTRPALKFSHSQKGKPLRSHPGFTYGHQNAGRRPGTKADLSGRSENRYDPPRVQGSSGESRIRSVSSEGDVAPCSCRNAYYHPTHRVQPEQVFVWESSTWWWE
jgi:hypothetical protein